MSVPNHGPAPAEEPRVTIEMGGSNIVIRSSASIDREYTMSLVHAVNAAAETGTVVVLGAALLVHRDDVLGGGGVERCRVHVVLLVGAGQVPPGLAAGSVRLRGRPPCGELGAADGDQVRVGVDEGRGDQRTLEVHDLVGPVQDGMDVGLVPQPRDLAVGHEHGLGERIGPGVHDAVAVQGGAHRQNVAHGNDHVPSSSGQTEL